jgi:hypothetical protein
MQAIAVRDRDAGLAGLSLADLPYPHAAENDVIRRVHPLGSPGGAGLGGVDPSWWPGPDAERARARGVRPRRRAGLGDHRTDPRPASVRPADWTRDGTLAEDVAIETRNLAPLPVGVDHAVAAGAVISGLTARQALFDHATSSPGRPC